MFRLLLNEYSALIKVGDIALITEIRSLGVRLFYALMNEYKVLKNCPPIEQLFVLPVLQSVGNVRYTITI